MKMFLQPRENRILRLSFTHDSTKIPLETYTEKLPPKAENVLMRSDGTPIDRETRHNLL
jgi:hypothetical protein